MAIHRHDQKSRQKKLLLFIFIFGITCNYVFVWLVDSFISSDSEPGNNKNVMQKSTENLWPVTWNEWMLPVNTMEPFGITINEIFISHFFLRRTKIQTNSSEKVSNRKKGTISMNKRKNEKRRNNLPCS